MGCAQGVHAFGQVAVLRTRAALTAAEFVRAINTRLPADVVVVGAEAVAESFCPQQHCVRKHYRYTLCMGEPRRAIGRQYVWHCPWGIDLAVFRAAAAMLEGTHDFTSLVHTDDKDADNVIEVSSHGTAPACLLHH